MSSTQEPIPESRLLLVDDEPNVLRALKRELSAAGLNIETAMGADEALALLRAKTFDAILSDISMPGLDGVSFLQAIRERDLEVPVILMTGGPALDTAMKAVEYGAFRYLVKPIDPAVLLETVQRALRLGALAKLKRQAFELSKVENRLGDEAGLAARFTNALDKMWIAFQPVVSTARKQTWGFEALLRTDEATLRNPLDFLEAGERLTRVGDLGRAIRARVAEAVRFAPEGTLLLVNLHSKDIADADLVSPDAPLSAHAARVILEITERAPLDSVPNVSSHVEAMRKLGFRIAIDDLGAGYAGLTALTQLDPELVKLDMSLIRGIHAHPVKQSVVRSISALCRDLKIDVIAEGVETAEEMMSLVGLGCDLMQGYFFAKPERKFITPRL